MKKKILSVLLATTMIFGLVACGSGKDGSGDTSAKGGDDGLIKVGSSLVPFANKFPKNTKLYKLMTTKPGEA